MVPKINSVAGTILLGNRFVSVKLKSLIVPSNLIFSCRVKVIAIKVGVEKAAINGPTRVYTSCKVVSLLLFTL